MMTKKQTYTVSIYTENTVGLLNRISAIFQRRKVNIESFNSSKSEIKSVSRITLLVKVTEIEIKKIIGQIEKQVEVIKAYYHTDDQIVYQETCLFKLNVNLLKNNNNIQIIFDDYKAKIIYTDKEFFVLKKSGNREQIEELYHLLEKYGIMQFIRSGRIAITKDQLKISSIIASYNNNQ